MQRALAAAATLVSLAFALSTLERWLVRRRRHELAWTAALAMFAAGSAALWYGASAGWGAPAFRLFYLFGAVLNVPFLALGTVYLLAGQRRGDRWAAAVSLAGAFAAGVVLSAPLTAAIPAHELPRGSEVFGPIPRVLAAVASAGGALVIFGGAAWSAWRVRRRRGPTRLAVGNGLIALGTLVLSAGGLLNSVLDEMTGFAVTLVAGVAVLFAGFLVASGGPPDARVLAPVETDRPAPLTALPGRDAIAE
jgi:hypothetical protein